MPHSTGRLLSEPNFLLKLLVAWPVMFAVYLLSCASPRSLRILFLIRFSDIPWLVAIYLMVANVLTVTNDLNALEAVVYWFSTPERIAYHALSRILRTVVTPILQLVFGILVKRLFGLNTECATADAPQLALLRRYIN